LTFNAKGPIENVLRRFAPGNLFSFPKSWLTVAALLSFPALASGVAMSATRSDRLCLGIGAGRKYWQTQTNVCPR
jgi:hypothetical protein